MLASRPILAVATTPRSSQLVHLALVVTRWAPQPPRWFVFARGLGGFPIEDLAADVTLRRA